MKATALLIMLSIAPVGCAASDGGDAIDDSFLGNGKADGFGVTDDSVEAIGVLAMLRTISVAELDAAGLPDRTSKQIVRHRQGPDNMDGTADDNPIDTLEELDAIPYVGSTAWALLLEHAQDIHAIPSADPFDMTFCLQDTALVMSDVTTTLAGMQVVSLTSHTAGVRARNRQCDATGACGDWQAGAPLDMFTLDGMTTLPIQLPGAGVAGDVMLAITPDGLPQVTVEGMVMVGGASPATKEISFNCVTAAKPTSDSDVLQFANCGLFLDQDVLHMNGTALVGGSAIVGRSCAQFDVAVDVQQNQREITLFARY